MSGGFFFEHIVEFLLPKQQTPNEEADVAKLAAQSVVKK